MGDIFKGLAASGTMSPAALSHFVCSLSNALRDMVSHYRGCHTQLSLPPIDIAEAADIVKQKSHSSLIKAQPPDESWGPLIRRCLGRSA